MPENNPTPSKVQKFYEVLANKGLSEQQIGSFDEFHTALTDEKSRKKLFDGLSNMGLNPAKDYDSFNSAISKWYEDDRLWQKDVTRSYVQAAKEQVDSELSKVTTERNKAFADFSDGTYEVNADSWNRDDAPQQPTESKEAGGKFTWTSQGAPFKGSMEITGANPGWVDAAYRERISNLSAAKTELDRAETTLDATEKKDVQGVVGAAKAFGQGISNVETEKFVPFVSGISEASHHSHIVNLSKKI